MTVRRTNDPRVEVPDAAAIHTVRTRRWALWIIARAGFIVVSIIPVLTPFPHVTAHIIKTKIVG